VQAIEAEAHHLGEVLAELREQDMPLTSTEAEVTVAALHSIAKQGATAAWRLGLHAVERGLMSQADLARLLDASTTTVNRRFRKGLDETEEQKIARADARTLPL
jgi:aspartate/methionine/tyrosine aminotransferase